MNNRARRPDLRELVGVSMNSSSLTISGRSPHAETSLLRVGALGLAALHVHHGADRLGVPVAMVVSRPEYRPDPQNVLEADLARNLWHIRYAGQHDAVPRAADLFAEWMGYRTRFRLHFEQYPPQPITSGDRTLTPDQVRSMRMRAFAAVVLHEWLSDRCIRCGGGGKLERSLSGAWLKPRGSMQRNAIFRPCPACQGSRRQAPSHGARARALSLTHQAYERERWAAHFKAATAWLNTEIRRLMRPLTVQLERSKRRE